LLSTPHCYRHESQQNRARASRSISLPDFGEGGARQRAGWGCDVANIAEALAPPGRSRAFGLLASTLPEAGAGWKRGSAPNDGVILATTERRRRRRLIARASTLRGKAGISGVTVP
jgi:hypothetical protein